MVVVGELVGEEVEGEIVGEGEVEVEVIEVELGELGEEAEGVVGVAASGDVEVIGDVVGVAGGWGCWPWCSFQWASAKACLLLLDQGLGFFRFVARRFALVASAPVKMGKRGGGGGQLEVPCCVAGGGSWAVEGDLVPCVLCERRW